MLRRPRTLAAVLLTLASLSGPTLFAPGCAPFPATRPAVAADTLPARLPDAAFWRIVAGFSEPDGYFPSDNLVSNESAFQHVIPELERRTRPGGVYIGVGPEQNFTYIVALHPRMAFIVDIRRHNMLLHLLYKAFFELSADRADFVSRLFARPRPSGIDRSSSARALFDAYETMPANDYLFHRNLGTVNDLLLKHHHFALSAEDLKGIEDVYRAFYAAGPEIRYAFGGHYGWRRFPSYADLMAETDQAGSDHSYLATEENFRALKALEDRNLIVPVVGDFAGGKALQSVGRFLKDRHATVAAFYTSNVEFYLFQGEAWKRFFSNVAELPLDEHSTFIRSYTNRAYWYVNQPAPLLVTLLDPIGTLVRDFGQGRIQTYLDVIERSK